MKITLAKTAGFCFGVDRAVNMVYDLVNKGKKVSTLGPIIHNTQMVADLESKGVYAVSNPEEVKSDTTLVIRSHGVSKSVFEQAEKLGLSVADATCPFVSKIHKIVYENSKNGSIILIAGDKTHQEVMGIVGHCCGETYVFSDTEELENIVKFHPEITNSEVCAVSQTTFNAKKWENAQLFLKKVCTNAKIFDTICNATAMRQSEARELALKNDAMIVIGGRHSSNTEKLFDICRLLCKKTLLIETADELKEEFFEGDLNVGVVAGASTPAGIIKEVIKTMSENLQPVDEQMEENVTVQKSFEEMTDEEAFEASLSNLTGDQKVVGTVLAVNNAEVQVDFGRGITGYITADEFSADPNVDLMSEVKVGDKLNLIIMKINDQEGTAMLSKRRFDAIAGWDNIVASKDSGEVLTGVVKDVIKGGVVVYSNNVRVFIPASQATASRNDSLEDLKGKEVSFRIIEIGRGRKAVGSVRSVLKEQRKEAEEKVWSNIAVGDRFTGVVKSLTTYGAFVDIGGVDGMVHISELSWQRIKNPAEVLSVGDTVEVYVKALDAEKKKISLGYKKEEDNPWTLFNNQYKLEDTLTVKIVSLTSYGAFARILPGVDGLIHISQIANKRVEKPQDELSVGQEVEVKIIAIDNEKKRVSLSIRALLPEAEPVKEEVLEADEVVATTEEPAKEEPVNEETAKEPAAEETVEEKPAKKKTAKKAEGEEDKAEKKTAAKKTTVKKTTAKKTTAKKAEEAEEAEPVAEKKPAAKKKTAKKAEKAEETKAE
ncbi:MAG: bifunctional 4-hydroxy-3-methylbut-2-enyl diphosphate reductase/30S ribosomal protein S1 [Clostridia bacterium]|nr:bifunctional 4-hydroxy-3-methylbut-2-enyl diphosphate reductase/30S ribosomal protein S1 [Clostridia bacterium]